MHAKVIFIEGLPGSGKTTFAKRLASDLKNHGYETQIHIEGDLHPIDLAWCSMMDEANYQTVLKDYPDYRQQIESNTKILDGLRITAYTKVRIPKDGDFSFYDRMEQHEIYRTEHLEDFKNAHLKLWRDFNRSAQDNCIYVFECVFLQNHINELMLKFNLDEKRVIAYFQELIDTLENLETDIVYIRQMNLPKTLERIVKERVDAGRNIRWIDMVIDYLEQSAYGKAKHYTGYDGTLRYFEDRQSLELEVLKHLKTNTRVIPLYSHYEDAYALIKQHYIKEK